MTEFVVGLVLGVVVVGALALLLRRRPRHDKGFDVIDAHTIGIQMADGKRVNAPVPVGVRPDQIDSARIAEGGEIEITMQDGRRDRVTGVVRDPDNPYR